MQLRFRLICLMALLLAQSSGAVTNGLAAQTISLSDALRMTLDRHPQIQSQDAAASMAEGARLEASGAFDSSLSAKISSANSDAPTYVADTDGRSSVRNIETDASSAQLGVSRPLRNGMILNPALSVNRDYTKDAGQIDQYDSTLGFTLTIPLLQGRGEAVSAQERAYQAEAEAQRLTVVLQASQQAFETISAYWQCVSAKAQLDIQRNIESNALEMVQLTRSLIEGYVQASNELAYTKAYWNQNAAFTLQAEARFSQSLATLYTAMGLETDPSSASPWIMPGDPFPPLPDVSALASDLSIKLAELAQDQRADLAAARKQLEAAQIRLAAARNALLPKMDVQVFGGYSGAAEGASPGSGAQALASNLEGPAFAATLSLEWPFYNTTARGGVLSAEGQLQQTQASMRLLVNQVMADVYSGLVNVRMYLDACTRQAESVGFYQQTLDDRQTLYKSGQDTLVNLINANSDLGSSQVDLVAAKVSALIAIAKLMHTTGSLVTLDGDRMEVHLKLPDDLFARHDAAPKDSSP